MEEDATISIGPQFETLEDLYGWAEKGYLNDLLCKYYASGKTDLDSLANTIHLDFFVPFFSNWVENNMDNSEEGASKKVSLLSIDGEKVSGNMATVFRQYVSEEEMGVKRYLKTYPFSFTSEEKEEIFDKATDLYALYKNTGYSSGAHKEAVSLLCKVLITTFLRYEIDEDENYEDIDEFCAVFSHRVKRSLVRYVKQDRDDN